ncbi:MAG TPA: cupin domain-containing protein [Solirubrobacter sp.]
MRLETWQAPPGDVIPNHPRFPVLLYRAVGLDDPRAQFAAHGWGGTWVSTVFDFHHFHSTSHEALAVLSGTATIELGGPQGEAFEVVAGDVLGLPAGTGHRRVRDDGGFRVMGAYPRGQEDYDLLREADEAALRRIAALGPPADDPVGGEGIQRWVVG